MPQSQLATDYERFAAAPPRDVAGYVREAYRIDLGAEYLGVPLSHPIGKASGQLSLNAAQLEADAAAGLAFVVLKTVIAEDAEGGRTMGAWAVHETRMRVEQRTAADGRAGWTVSWKGRGWDRSFDEYLALVRSGRDISSAGGPLVLPSVKYHLPAGSGEFNDGEYRHTTSQLAAAWGDEPLLLEKDFSPTLAGDDRAGERAAILRWLREVPGRVRAAAPRGVRIALKLMNARFDDAFQLEMVEAAAGADALVVFNRLWDEHNRIAYGGYDLSERNLRVLAGLRRTRAPHPPLCGTGNIVTGRLAVQYARLGCTAVQVHTGFQLPQSEYAPGGASRSAKLLHRLIFEPADGLVAAILELAEQGQLHPVGGELRFLDLCRSRPPEPV